MKLFIDSADIDEIKEAKSYGILDGVTTNPSLIKKAVTKHGKRKKLDMEDYINKILEDKDFLVRHKEQIVNGFSNTFLTGSHYEFSDDENSRYYDKKY